MCPGEGPLSTVPVVRKSSDKLRVNPRKSWYANLDRVTTNGDYEVAFHLKRAQPGFLTFLAFSLAGSLGRVASRRSPAVSGKASIEPYFLLGGSVEGLGMRRRELILLLGGA